MTDLPPTSNPTPGTPAESPQQATPDQNYEKLVDQVTERVWKLWRDDLRRSVERRGADASRLRFKDRR